MWCFWMFDCRNASHPILAYSGVLPSSLAVLHDPCLWSATTDIIHTSLKLFIFNLADLQLQYYLVHQWQSNRDNCAYIDLYIWLAAVYPSIELSFKQGDNFVKFAHKNSFFWHSPPKMKKKNKQTTKTKQIIIIVVVDLKNRFLHSWKTHWIKE